VIRLVLALMAAQPASAARRPAKPAASELGEASRRTAAATTTRAARCSAGSSARAARKDWALFVLAESEFYDGNYRAAREDFEKLARGTGGRRRWRRSAPPTACGWRATAPRRPPLRELAKTATARTGDVALARFRIAEQTADATARRANKQFLAIARDFPSHPLADEAIRRIGRRAGARDRPPATPDARQPPPPAQRSVAR
jgi:hypothetical protein